MKIVYLAPFGIRPKGTVIARMLPLAVELQQLGHTVIIVAPPYTNPEDSGRVEVIRGVRLINVILPSGGKAWSALVLTARLFRAVRREKPDLVHLFKPKGYGGLAAMLHIMLQRLGFRLPPLFLDTDDWEGKGGMNELQSYSLAEKRLFAFQEEWLSLKAAGVTVASRALDRLSRGMGVLPEQVLYLPNCVEETLPGNGGRIRKKLDIPVETPVVLLYTRFFEFEQQRLHQVFAGIHRRVPDVRFLVVGSGRRGEEKELRAASRIMGFDAALVMAGWVETQDIPDYLAAADVAVYPMDDTLTNRAKCPAKLTELLLAGVPTVADGVGQVLEYIEDDVSGVLCRCGDPDRMAEETAALLRDTERRKRISSEGSRRLLNCFNWHDAALTLDQFYRSMTNQ